ncbi:MAG: LysM peptidoglycan-binding domain-containing protein [Bacteroidia bacterium]|nr:LysM peptidoglycan-binding domain-containing protein [Bacteroidia bacterium]
MKKLFFLVSFSFCLSAFANPLDSIGVKKENGKTFVLHKISKGEGVYGIGRKYGVNAEDIFAANPGSKEGIQAGTVLMIPVKWNSATTSSTTTTAQNSGTTTPVITPANSGSAGFKTEKKYHKVEKGQTLSFIAKKYNVSIDKIKSMNNLKSDNINLGQKLVVGETKVPLPGNISVPEVVELKEVETSTVTPEKTETKYTTTTEPNEAVNVVVDQKNVKRLEATPVGETTVQTSKPVTASVIDDGDEITETGSAKVSSEGELAQERNFIIHPKAKVGTIVMITNTENNKAVFARVVANYKPDSGNIVKMSRTVADKLGLDSDSQVKINYAQ